MNNHSTQPHALSFGALVGASKRMQDLYTMIERVSRVELPVLIVGETGTGKELVAKEIHQRSPRRKKPFVALNMSAIPSELVASELFGHQKGAFTSAHEMQRGRFEEAKGGTLFLDEIITMEDKVQLTLLRVLENHMFRRVGGQRDIKTDVRIIASSNQNPLFMVRSNLFRMDLYHRLQTLRINIPPLRKRKRDIERLVHHFLAQIRDEYDTECKEVSSEAMKMLKAYSWPGNVRELKNVILQACVHTRGGVIEAENLPDSVRDVVLSGKESPVFPEVEAVGDEMQSAMSPPAEPSVYPSVINQVTQTTQPSPEGVFFPMGLSLQEVEKAYTLKVLTTQANNKSKTARLLGISRKALYERLKRWGLDSNSE